MALKRLPEALKLSILYRGPLSSCNYDCHYCPFAKHHETAAELADDRRKLRRFVQWVGDRPASDEIRVFFTPWGEALTRRWYQEAIAELSHLPHVRKVAVQTNLSCRPGVARELSSRTARAVVYLPSLTDNHRCVRCAVSPTRSHRRAV